MACDGGFSVSSLSFNSGKIKLMLVLVTLVCETCICTEPETSEINRISNGESMDEAINQSKEKATAVPSFRISLESQDGDVGDDDLIVYKRHLGAIAAMSGPKFGSKYFVPPSKKHLGSIAAQSMGRAGGRTLELSFPTKLEMYKRHLGALKALTGYKSKPLTRSLKESPTYQIDFPADTLKLEAPPMTYNVLDTHNNYDGIRIPARYNVDSQEIQISPDILLMNADEPVSPNEHMRLDEGLNENGEGTELGDDERTFKSKRFLGSLARGNWFPRQFRGIVSEKAFGKRHIGSLARLGWMPQPHPKGNSRLGMIMEDQRGEVGLKRNDMSPRRRMLYHFSAPSLWTSPRGK